jgi:hypothetical protein
MSSQASILLIAAETVADGKHVVSTLGFGDAQALGHVRIVTEPHGLRGWRAGTPVLFLCSISPAARGHAHLSNEMLDALDAYARAGLLCPVNREEATTFTKGVMR